MPPLSGCVETAAPAAPKEQKPGGGRNLRRKRRAPRPQETPSLPPYALRDAFAGLRPARSVQPHMFHAAPAQRPPSGPQPDEKDFRNSRFSATAPSGVRRHISRRFLPCSRRALRQRSAGNNRLFGAKNGGPATGNDRKELPPVQLPKNTGFTSGSADDKPPHDAPGSTSAQRPDARSPEHTPRHLAPCSPTGNAQSSPGAAGSADRFCKKPERPAPLPDLILLVK